MSIKLFKKKPKIIISLDYTYKKDAMNLVQQLDPSLYYLKIGKKMFTLYGNKFIYELKKLNFNIFLDLKFYDIPSTVASAVKAAADIGVFMLTIHVSGGKKMMKEAYNSLIGFKKKEKPLLIGVTVLTSFNKQNLKDLFIFTSIKKYVLILSKLAYKCKLNGVVCPGNYVPYIKKKINNINKKFQFVVPGIRIKNNLNHDHYNFITPEKSIKNKINYIVLGRTITNAYNPLYTLKNIFK
ncbi:orotidine-5'-phosphate decarboxylase [Buchnera aphidicola]|uniref:orotidine-5'-phosphate decarboxylase n=1 Tax=Buchnera aphidicola TaxID=9 RepID=UPI0031B8AB3C